MKLLNIYKINIYKINCRDCNVSYVGQTKRKLKIHKKEHIKAIIKKFVNTISAVSHHQLNMN